MLPKKEYNIYRKSDENLKSLISFYLDKYDVIDDNGIQFFIEETSLSLNQIEYIIRKISEAYIPVLQKHYPSQMKLSNLLKYGIDALTRKNFNGTASRNIITNELQEFIRKTEIG